MKKKKKITKFQRIFNYVVVLYLVLLTIGICINKNTLNKSEEINKIQSEAVMLCLESDMIFRKNIADLYKFLEKVFSRTDSNTQVYYEIF